VRGGSGGGGIMRKVELFDPNSYGTRRFICLYIFDATLSETHSLLSTICNWSRDRAGDFPNTHIRRKAVDNARVKSFDNGC